MNGLYVFLIIICVFLIFFFGIGEYCRHNCTLSEEFANTDTSNASFSLTTTPSRINDLEPTLKSLLEQKPKTVYLNIPYIFKKTGEKYVIPKWFDKYHDKITIIRPEDKGPATKFMGLLEHKGVDPEEYICIVDDDMIYHELLLSNIVHKAEQFKGKHVISNTVYYTPPKILGVYGFLFKRKLLDGIKNYKTSDKCFKVDDPWITSYFLHNKIPITKLTNGSWATAPSANVVDFYTNFFNEIDDILKKSGFGVKNPLWKTRAIDENLNCVKSIHTINEENEHNQDILKYLFIN